jgi:hypothetical protein
MRKLRTELNEIIRDHCEQRWLEWRSKLQETSDMPFGEWCAGVTVVWKENDRPLCGSMKRRNVRGAHSNLFLIQYRWAPVEPGV